MPILARPLTRRTDARGVPYVQMQIRVTGEATIAILERLCAATATPPAQVASDLVLEELWYLGVPGMRDHVRRTRAERRHRHGPARDSR